VEHLGENRIIHGNLPLVSDEDRDRLNRYTLKEGDIIFSRVGSVYRRAFVKKDVKGCLFSGRCLRVRPNPKIVDPSYLSWFFGHPKFKDYIRRIELEQRCLS
jgi:type I restriction enzyme, S subunit